MSAFLPSARLLAGLLLAATVAVGGARAGLADDTPGVPASAPKPAETLEARIARWRKHPSVSCGVDLQDAWLAEGKEREAAAFFKAEHDKAPESGVVSFLYGRVRGGEKGIEMMRAALADHLGYTTAEGGADGAGKASLLSAWLALALAEVQAHNAKEAEDAARQVAALRGTAADWTWLGWIQERLQGAQARAAISYRRAIQADENHLAARNALAILLAESGHVDEALTIARGSAAKHARSAGAQLHLGLVLALAKDKKGAVEAYGKALACAGDDVDDLAAIASGYMDIEEQTLAHKALSRALELNPEHGEALSNMGMLLMDMGDMEGAQQHLKRAAKVLPQDSHVAFLEGVCAERLGKDDAAVRAYKRAAELDPERVEYVTALALAYLKKDALSSAVREFQRAVKMDPRDPSLRLQLGITYMKQRKHKQALQAFGEAANAAPKDPRPHYYMAVIHGDKLGKAKEALDALETYKRLGGKEPTALAWLEDLREQLGK